MRTSNFFTLVCQILVGSLFVFSGLLKVNDPHGFAYKLIEYFEVFQNDIGFGLFFVDYAFTIATVLAIFEVWLGLWLLMGYAVRFTTIALFGLIIFFTLLTFYSWAFDKVQDCGCFGDFLHLTPKESFIKDVVLSVLISYLLLYPSRIGKVFGNKRNNMRATWGLSLLVPIMAIGTLTSGPVVDMLGACKGCDFKKHVENPTKPKGIKEWWSLKQFCETDGMTGKTLIVVIKRLSEEETAQLTTLSVTDKALGDKVNFVLTTASPGKNLQKFKQEQKPTYCVSRNGGDVLKTIIRNNKGALLLKDGVVIEKWVGSIPNAKDVLEELED